MSAGDISVIGRGSAGSRLFRVADDERVVSVAKIEESDEEEIEVEGSDEIAPDPEAVIEESELEKPADPEQE
jgi:DNA gyrase subunit A